MGMFDTIIFDQPIPCPTCGAEIRSDQTKAFENLLHDYRIGDCIAHAEEIRIVRDELFCDQCRSFADQHYYLAVYRGILIGVEQTREAAEALVRGFSFEKLLLWYHDLYRTRQRARADTRRAEAFMHNVCEWFERGHDKAPPDGLSSLLFFHSREILENSDTPVAALRRYLAEREAEPAGDGEGLDLW